ncbi:hypothetical protein C1645_828725 [Glomus cerebriforme]|uniref:Uncharacterized protein n=1 Tax=Glomus cerebriforme TaxID=658196 RepID=A0A397SVQ4_9GLOM|nr:hypothetical protein C1645_828725 [Glomus cerebriforme]
MSDFYENKLDLSLYDDDVNYENESKDLYNTFYNELEDSSLKEIYNGQTFISFKVLEQTIENRFNLSNQDQDEVSEESRKKNKW